MAQPEKTPAPATPTTADAPAPAKKGILGKVLKVGAIVLVVTLVECSAMYLYFPSSTPNNAQAQPQQEVVVDEGPEDGKDKLTEQAEVKLGEFRVTAYQPLSNTTLRIDFQLYGTIAASDADEFKQLMEQKGHRFREQVIVIIRGADLTDLTDAGLGLLKRRILATTNKTLGKTLLHSVVFSDFSFVEQ
jgi:flagellar FliL protein